ncbi:transport and Golgi organization protein 1 [Parasteatoda tepidariorum]|uniref:transport and Golgi organization protein 1 n=1 Tax=Parasteatoda tepidariorum TaxID=114398 RepID=UPI00077FDF7F|nr:transport and Golgi organization protein 1 isoform X2 [Parasteatoda tepidariorum]
MGKPTRNIFKLFIIIFFKFLHVSSQDFKFGWCADPECSVPVAVGITTINYHPPDRSRLGFQPNQEVIVYVREYGEKRDLLGIEINGRKGYAPKNFIRETKSLAKAVVPANVEFLHTPSRSFVHHETSHLHMSSNIPSVETPNFIHTTVPNTLNPQQSMQGVQHSEVHLESSRHDDNSHFHASSDLYIAKNADSRNHFSQSGSINYQTSHVDFSSHSHFGSENTMASNFVPNAEILSNSHGSVQSYQTTQSTEPHWQNPSSQYYSQPNLAHETINSNMRQNFDSQSNNLFHSQGFDPQSNVLHHSQSPHTTPQQTTHNQMFTQSHTQSNIPHMTQNQMVTQSHTQSNIPPMTQNQMVTQSNTRSNVPPMTQNQMVTQSNTQSNVPPMTQNQMSTQSHIQSNVPPMNNFDEGYDETMALLQNQGYNTAGEFTNQFASQHHSEKQTTSFQSVPSENLGWNQDFHNKQPFMQSEHTPELVSSDHNNLNNPSSVLNMDHLQQMVDSLFTEDIPITPSQPIATQETSTFPFEERMAAKVDRIRKLAKTFESTFEEHSKVEDVNEMEDEDDEEDYVDYEAIYSSKSMKMSLLDKTEKDLDLAMKTEQSNTVSEHLVTKSDISHTVESALSERESNVQETSTSSTANVPKESGNQDLFEDSVSKSDLHEKKIESNENVFEKKVGAILETTKELNNISSNKDEHSNDDSSNSSISEESDDTEVLSEDKEIDSDIDAEISDDKDLVFNENENVLDINRDTAENVNGSESFDLSSDSSKLDNLLNVSEFKETESNLLNAYQTRHLKDVESDADSFSSTEETEQSGSNFEFDIYIAVENTFVAIRTFIDALLPWIPEPLYTILMDLEKEGISPKVTVFTALSAIPCIILIVSLVFIKGKSKENKLIARLTVLERNFYNLTAEKIILEEKLEKAELELQISRGVIEEEKILSFKLKTEIESLKQQLEETTLELEKNVDEVETVRKREHEYVELIHDHEKEHLKLLEQKGEVENRALEFEETLVMLRESLQEKEVELQNLLAEKSEYRQANEIYEEKVSLLQKNCNQLLQEAEVWNLRVNELNEKLSLETQKNEEAEKSLQEKITEIESLSEAVQLFKTFEEIGGDSEECKTSEEKLKYLKNSTHNLMKLQKQEEENRLLSERLTEAKNRLLDIEVSILDVKSENDKLKVNYNQALQDKAEAQTKLEVLTNYFKDKEIQLQKQLGVQEAVRQRTEEDATSAERRICLIEQENASYKYQVASMKQEIEETERNLKSQISLHEKKAHENWLAARTAERKLEDTKQEVTQLRQRLTLLEREQENWSNSTRDEIIRPVPKRISNMNDDSVNTQDSNSSLELRSNLFPPPPPMMLPPDRPLPPLPPLPPFLRPFDPPPPFESLPPFQPQPWNMPPPDAVSNSDFRMTPSDYGRGRESTPPRGRNSAVVDGDLGPRQSSPITDLKNSRNSTPPHLLPDFHDIPPHPSRPFYPPPMGPRTRYPMPPRFPPTNFRREYPGQRRIDNQEENSSTYGSQNAPVPPDDWHNSNTRV